VLDAIPDGSRALIVSHGGSIEPALVTCLPDVDHESWGQPFAHGDGVRLSFVDGAFVTAEFIRSPVWPTYSPAAV